MPGRLACALLAAAFACAPAADEPGDVVLLLSGNTLDGSDLAARLLQDMARATDVLGPVTVRAAGAPGEGPGDLVAHLRRHPVGELRAVVAVIGDRSLLPGVDPNHPVPDAPGVLSRRAVDERALDEALEDLAAEASRHGARLVLATAPLGQQGRIELPELGAVAERLRARGPVLDLAALFRPHERAALFADGLDRLCAWGHEELARVLYGALLDGEGWLPARSDDEERAREQMRTLRLWATARHPSFGRGARAAIARADAAWRGPPSGDTPDPAALARERTRIAALVSLLSGATAETLARWEQALPAGLAEDADVPGLAVALRLAGLPAPAVTPLDPVERAWLRLLEALAPEAREPDGTSSPADPATIALDLVGAHPHRLEAWLALATGTLAPGLAVSVRGPALATVARLGAPPAAATRWEQVLAESTPLVALPALLVASRPEAALRPRGAELERARRAALLGMLERARSVLDQALTRKPAPPAWAAERALLDAAQER